MKVQRMLLIATVLLVFVITSQEGLAADFDWMKDFNIRAQADPSGFRAQLATRFRIGDTQITAVLGNVQSPADAYMIFRLGEMASRPPDYVLGKYKRGKGKGWGVIAQGLGIKPGSQEFHALKRGSDLYDVSQKGKDKGKGKGKGKN